MWLRYICLQRLHHIVSVNGCWFHYAQSIIKRLQKLGLKADDYVSEATVQDTVRCQLGLPLLPVDDIRPALDDVKEAAADDSAFASKLHDLIHYAAHFLLIDFFRPQWHLTYSCVLKLAFELVDSSFLSRLSISSAFSSLTTAIKSGLRIQAWPATESIFTSRYFRSYIFM